jgi:HEAT repeat protein
MKLWLRVTIPSALIAAFLAVLILGRRPSDPFVSGRPASAWANDLLKADYQTRGNAQAALAQLGEGSVPQLRILLQASTPSWQPYFSRFARLFPFLTAKAPDPGLCRQRGAEMIALLGPRGHDAAPDLIPSLGYTEAADDAERALLRIGDASISAVIAGLRARNPVIRTDCARVLRGLSHEPRCVAPLLAATRDEEATVRSEAALTLGEFSANDEKIVPALLKLTHDEFAGVRAVSCQSLGKLGRNSPPILEALRAGMRDEIPLVRVEAAKSFWSITGDSGAVMPVLIGVLPTPEGWQAAYALGNMGPEAAPAVPALIEALKREKVPRAFRTPPSTSFALGQIHEPAIAELEKVLDHPRPEVRLAAVLAFGNMGQHARSALPALERLLHDPDDEIRHVTAITLATIGAEREVVLASLADCLHAEDIYMRSTAAALLREIAPEQQWVVAPE